MAHGDDAGLCLPPMIAPTQVCVIPIQQKKEGVLEKASEIYEELKSAGIRVKVDDSDKSPGWKFSEAEMRGISLRIEIGPRDIENGKCVIVRRDTREKTECSLDAITETVNKTMTTMQSDMYDRAKEYLDSHIDTAVSYGEFVEKINRNPGFIKGMWCGNVECEEKIKEETTATSRCIPFEQEEIAPTCVCCGKPAKRLVYWGKAY